MEVKPSLLYLGFLMLSCRRSGNSEMAEGCWALLMGKRDWCLEGDDDIVKVFAVCPHAGPRPFKWEATLLLQDRLGGQLQGSVGLLCRQPLLVLTRGWWRYCLILVCLQYLNVKLEWFMVRQIGFQIVLFYFPGLRIRYLSQLDTWVGA